MHRTDGAYPGEIPSLHLGRQLRIPSQKLREWMVKRYQHVLPDLTIAAAERMDEVMGR